METLLVRERSSFNVCVVVVVVIAVIAVIAVIVVVLYLRPGVFGSCLYSMCTRSVDEDSSARQGHSEEHTHKASLFLKSHRQTHVCKVKVLYRSLIMLSPA